MTHDTVLYEGKAKQLLPTEDESILIQRFKDEATAFNGVKFAVFEGKGALNCAISSHLYTLLERAGVHTHFLERSDAIDMRVKKLSIIPIEVVVRNVSAGSLSKRIGWEEGVALPESIVETYYKKDELGDPMLAPTHVAMLGLVSHAQWQKIKACALRVNEVLRKVFDDAHISLVDFKLEFGTTVDGAILLGDEISPDTCRLWDKKTSRKLDKDVFRRDLADLVETYKEVAHRLGVVV